MIESLAGGGAAESEELADLLKRLAPRWFLMRNAQGGESASLLQPRWAMSFMRGPMTRWEIQEARRLGRSSVASGTREQGAEARAVAP